MKNNSTISLLVAMATIFSWIAAGNIFVGLTVATALFALVAAISTIEKR